MRERRLWRLAGGAALVGLCTLAGCGDDDPVAADPGGSGGGGGSGGPVDTGDEPGPCVTDEDCVHDDPCQAGTCEADGSCSFAPALTNECRPQIDIEFPPRAATVQGQGSDPHVTVIGTVRSGAGSIESVRINGDEVEVGPDGAFTHDIPATVGGNMLVVEAVDSADFDRRRVQSFLWSTDYRKPTTPPDDIVPEGLAIYLGQETLDDDDTSLPVDDLATLFSLVFDNAFDLSAIAGPGTPITSVGGYDLTLESLGFDSTQVDLKANDWGMALHFDLLDTSGALALTCNDPSCQALGNGNGSIGLDLIRVGGTLLMQVDENHQLQLGLADVETDFSGLNIDTSNQALDFIGSLAAPVIELALFPILEQTLEAQIQQAVGPLLQQGLGNLGLNTQFPLPNPAGGDPIVVDLVSDFEDTDFHDGQAPPQPSPPQGGALILRAGAFASTATPPYDNFGIPSRAGCGTGEGGISMPRASALEIGLADDFVNQLLYAAWTGGLLELPLGDVLGGSGGGPLPVSDLSVDLSGMLAPTASDCASEGQLLVYIGDLRVDASLTFTGQPVDFVAFISMAMELDITADETGLGFGFGDVTAIETELTIEQDESIGLEPLIIGLLESQIQGGLLGNLAGDGFGGIPLPQIDLSAQLGLDPGTAVLSVQIDSVEHVEGTTVLGGHLGAPPADDGMP